MNFNRKTFFDAYRLKFGPLAQLQVDGLSFLLDKIESDPEWKTVPQISYFLATVKHETGTTRGGLLQTYQPIKELRGREGTKIRRVQDRYWASGFYGRGFIQITWEDNYRKFGIADTPERALDPEVAYDIAARGMRKGMFTKYKLSDFLNGETDYIGARQIVNGHDKAALIAGYAETFEDILFSSLRSATNVAETPETVQTDTTQTAQNPEPPAAPQPPKPEVTPVGKAGTSIVTKIAAGASAAGPIVAATGLKIGGVEFKTGGLIAFAAVLIVGMVVAAWLWNESQKRRREEQKESMLNLADPNRRNIVAAGSQV